MAKYVPNLEIGNEGNCLKNVVVKVMSECKSILLLQAIAEKLLHSFFNINLTTTELPKERGETFVEKI
ncbi:hypothetical protein QUF63_01290 [Anaerolineales bacterium HSG25]|nr:hypothetical protein [Anaerolineales bacterium HSG25]